MKKFRECPAVSLVMGFVNRTSEDHVGAYAAQAAFFLIMSFIPFIMFLSAIIKYTPLTYGVMRQAILSVIPVNLQNFVMSVVVEVYERNSTVASITSVAVALWSSVKGLMSLINGLNSIYHVHETRNWLLRRIQAMFYTILFVIALIVSLILLVLGNRIQMELAKHFPLIGEIIARIIGARTFIVFGVLFLVFLFLYKGLPNRKASFKSQVPGALLTAVAWSVFSYGFSIYFSFFPGFSNMYGSLTAIILVMLWIYVCMLLLLYGAEFNAYFEKQLREARQSVYGMISREKKEPEEKQADGTEKKS